MMRRLISISILVEIDRTWQMFDVNALDKKITASYQNKHSENKQSRRLGLWTFHSSFSQLKALAYSFVLQPTTHLCYWIAVQKEPSFSCPHFSTKDYSNLIFSGKNIPAYAASVITDISVKYIAATNFTKFLEDWTQFWHQLIFPRNWTSANSTMEVLWGNRRTFLHCKKRITQAWKKLTTSYMQHNSS